MPSLKQVLEGATSATFILRGGNAIYKNRGLFKEHLRDGLNLRVLIMTPDAHRDQLSEFTGETKKTLHHDSETAISLFRDWKRDFDNVYVKTIDFNPMHSVIITETREKSSLQLEILPAKADMGQRLAFTFDNQRQLPEWYNLWEKHVEEIWEMGTSI